MSSKGNPQRRKQVKRRIPIGRPTSFHVPKTMYDKKKERQFSNKINSLGGDVSDSELYWEAD